MLLARPPASTLFPYTTLFRSMDEHLPFALDILADLVLNPLFRQEDIEKEKGVILEEIKMEADQPEFVLDRKSTRLNSSHSSISYAVFCLKKKSLNLILVVRRI